MKIFDKRPLALILCIILGSFVFFYFSGLALKIILFSALLFVGVLSFIIRTSKINIRFVRALIIISLISSLLSFLYFECYFKAYQRYVGVVEIEAEVTEFQETDCGYSVDLKTKSVNQTLLSRYLLKTELSYDESTNISLGSCVKITGKILPFLSYDGKDSYYLSLGYSGYVDEIETIEITGFSENLPGSFLRRIREIIKLRIIGSTDENVGGLITALFLGDKSELHGQISLDFRRIGISHLLAISGAHFSILILGLSKILQYLGVNKKLRSVITILSTLLYVALAGFSLSVMRAGLMLIILYVLYLSKYKSDSVTSLFIAVFLIALIEPYALLSLSLWLSALATFGIIGVSQTFNDGQSNKAKPVKAVLVSLFAVYTTLLVSNLFFDGLTYLSVLTTLIFTPLIAGLLLLSLPLVIFNSLGFIKIATNAIANFTINLAAKISDFRFAFLQDDYVYVSVLIILFTVLLTAFFILPIKRKKASVAILTAFYLFIQVSALALSIKTERTDVLKYADLESEVIFIGEKEESTLILIDDAGYNEAAVALDFLSSEKRTYLDNCILISYSSKMEISVLCLLNSTAVSCLYLPTPQNDYELEKASKILEITKYYKAEVSFYDLSQVLNFKEYAIAFTSRNVYRGEDKDGLFFFIIKDGTYYSYADAGAFDGRYKDEILEVLSVSDTLILGKYDECEFRFNYKIRGLKNLIVSNELLTMGEDVYSFYQYQKMHFYPERVNLIK